MATCSLIPLCQRLISVQISTSLKCAAEYLLCSGFECFRLAQRLRATMEKKSNMDPKHSSFLAYFDTLCSYIAFPPSIFFAPSSLSSGNSPNVTHPSRKAPTSIAMLPNVSSVIFTSTPYPRFSFLACFLPALSQPPAPYPNLHGRLI